MPLWRGGPNTRTLPTVLLTPSASKAADMAHLCVPQNQALGVCRGFVPDIQICGTHGRKNLVNATIISNAEEEEEAGLGGCDERRPSAVQCSRPGWVCGETSVCSAVHCSRPGWVCGETSVCSAAGLGSIATVAVDVLPGRHTSD